MSEARKARRRFGEVAKLSGGRFSARYRGPDGNRHNAPVTFLSVGHAEAWLEDQYRLIVSMQWRPRSALASIEVPFGEYATAAISRRDLRPATADRYERLLGREILPAFRDAALTTITSDRVAKWFAGMAGTPAQRADAYGLFKSIMHDALQDGLVERNPAQVSGGSRKAPRHEMVVLTVDQLQRYLEAVPVRWRAALVMAGWCGLRSGEVRGLRVQDLDVGAGVVRVRQVVVRLPGRLLVQPPKAAAAMRDVAIPPHLLPALQHWMDDRADRDPAALLFRAADGLSPLNDTVLRNAHHRARRAINMPQLTIQDLRHTSVTMAAQQGATVAELQARLGHATPRMVQRYEVAAAERNRAPKARSSAFGHEHPDKQRGADQAVEDRLGPAPAEGATSQSRAQPTPRGPRRTQASRERAAAVRAWAHENGLELSPRGRISRAVKEAYDSRTVSPRYQFHAPPHPR